MKTTQKSEAVRRSGHLVGLVIGMALSLLIVSESRGQQCPTLDETAPGLMAQQTLIASPELAGYVQPVQIFSPEGSLLSTWSSQGYGVAHDSVLTVGLTLGQVYRFRISNIRRNFDREVYPSIEVIDRLHPPQGMTNQFPIQIVITLDDLEKALQGGLVTKVIYLEDGELALPYRAIRDDQPYFDIGPSEDPLRTAKRMGRPMAIVRIGSRVPTFDDMTTGQFDFYSSPVFEMPHPQPVQGGFESDGNIPIGEFVPRQPEPNLPPVVPGQAFRNYGQFSK
jgi:hypothetical protein